jgi:membrane protease YdiL (CAAX protease family)
MNPNLLIVFLIHSSIIYFAKNTLTNSQSRDSISQINQIFIFIYLVLFAFTSIQNVLVDKKYFREWESAKITIISVIFFTVSKYSKLKLFENVFNKKHVLLSVFGGIVWGLTITNCINSISIPNDLTFYYTVNGVIYLFIFFIFLPVISEEILFRGFLFEKLSPHYSTLFTIFFTSILFSLVHIFFQETRVMLWIFPLGIVLCYLRFITKSIYPSIFFHFVYNTTTLYNFLY